MIEFDLLLQPSTDPDGHQILPHIHAYGYINPEKAKKSVEQLSESERL